MQYAQQQWSRTQVEALMGISAALADYTSSLELTEQLPHYLSRELDLESLTLAIVRDVPAEGEPRLFLRSSSGMVATGEQHLRIVGTTVGKQVAGRSLERFHVFGFRRQEAPGRWL